jgi:hypothetical protein
VDLQGLGYLLSIASVFLLGAVAWPKPEDPSWVLPALVAGMTTSIIGMALRYAAHIRQNREVERAKAIAAQSR